ncbi:MAG TPA: sensor histidine kinase [Xanthobacteraceae bacterium]|nr:sensor histidine kinase [Xanthobacteraceae bacterium]
MSKRAAEHHKKASKHLAAAACHHEKAAAAHEIGRYETETDHAYEAGRHRVYAKRHAQRAWKDHVEHVDVLMREARHRVKNTLAVVQATARRTAADHPEDFLTCLSERIQALANNQDLLTRSDGRGVEVDDLVGAHFGPFADLIGSRIVLHGPKLRLNAAASEVIGLALHELATNAAKYGALSVEDGRIDVDWRRDDDMLVMQWTEHDGPLVSRPERQGFGCKVITSLPKAIGAETDLDYARSGVTWRFTVPAANALQPTA